MNSLKRKTPRLLILLLALATPHLTGCRSHAEVGEAATEAQGPEIDAAEIVSAFERDEQSARRLYAGKRIRVAGYHSSVEQRPDGSLAMTLKTSISTFRPIRCVMRANADVEHLEPGTPVTVSGKVDGFSESTYYVLLEDCQKL
jgi:outer membrane murein-binding lipoprotein Lpp